MAENTTIPWCHHTFNPWWGCTKVSDGCANCYAEGVANRFSPGLWGPSGRRRFFGDKHWQQPHRWNARAAKRGIRERVFCGSMCDVFERLPHGHPDRIKMAAQRIRLLRIIDGTPWLDWLLLTKRPENVEATIGDVVRPNVWAGTTVENQAAADERIPQLLRVPARVRFLSCEPLLSEVDIGEWLMTAGGTMLDWVIAGCESGPRARPTDIEWLRSLSDQCADAGVAYFIKQMKVDGKLAKMPLLDGVRHDAVPERRE